jgi:E3 ubiquitin-protein ligase SspH2
MGNITIMNLTEYLNILPDNTTYINLSKQNLTELPDLSKFYNLQEFNCSHNYLTCLPALPPLLKFLYCNDNFIQKIPDLNSELISIHCFNNKIEVLPKFNSKLKILKCSNNKIKDFPLNITNLSYFEF